MRGLYGPSAVSVRLARARAQGPTVALSNTQTNQELAYVQLRAIEEEVIGRRQAGLAGSLPDDWPFRYEAAPPDVMKALAEVSARARQLDLTSSFEQQLLSVQGNAELRLKPSPSQVATWKAAFLDSYGTVVVSWSDRGTPEMIWGIRSGGGARS